MPPPPPVVPCPGSCPCPCACACPRPCLCSAVPRAAGFQAPGRASTAPAPLAAPACGRLPLGPCDAVVTRHIRRHWLWPAQLAWRRCALPAAPAPAPGRRPVAGGIAQAHAHALAHAHVRRRSRGPDRRRKQAACRALRAACRRPPTARTRANTTPPATRRPAPSVQPVDARAAACAPGADTWCVTQRMCMVHDAGRTCACLPHPPRASLPRHPSSRAKPSLHCAMAR